MPYTTLGFDPSASRIRGGRWTISSPLRPSETQMYDRLEILNEYLIIESFEPPCMLSSTMYLVSFIVDTWLTRFSFSFSFSLPPPPLFFSFFLIIRITHNRTLTNIVLHRWAKTFPRYFSVIARVTETPWSVLRNCKLNYTRRGGIVALRAGSNAGCGGRISKGAKCENAPVPYIGSMLKNPTCSKLIRSPPRRRAW